MVKEDNEQKSGQQQPEGERRFNQDQYDLLKSCSDKKDMTEWNKWREEHPAEEIWLQGAVLIKADLKNAGLWNAHMEKADLRWAHLENANLIGIHLENAMLWQAHLENTEFIGTYLENSEFIEANLQGVSFSGAKLQGADFSRAIIDSGTMFSEECEVDRYTKFEAVALGNMRIYPSMRQLLEYNIRCINWEEWYKGKSKNKWIIKMHQLLTLPVRLFWCVSNYGLSTWRIIFTFFALAFVFAMIYWLWPKCVLVNGIVGDIKGFVHALYFSVVTMTTLGFGDIAANPDSWQGQVLLMVQVILGYVLLGALVTRFAVLFTAGGPAGKFSPTKTKETGEGEEKKA